MNIMTTSESDMKLIGILENIKVSMSKLNIKVPPPEVFSNDRYESIEDFLVMFVRYCRSEYGDNQLSWLAPGPSILLVW